jgi:hypothetical protein
VPGDVELNVKKHHIPFSCKMVLEVPKMCLHKYTYSMPNLVFLVDAFFS